MPGVNDPHPNESADTAVAEAEQPAVADPEDFFGPEKGEDEVGVEPTPEAAVEPEPEPEPEPEAAAEPAAAQPAPSEPQADGADEDDKGNKREYVVLQEIALDKELLENLLKEVKGGVKPRAALVEVHRATFTTALAALRDAWNTHKEEWEAPPRLAAVSASKLKVRTMRARTREVTGFDFE